MKVKLLHNSPLWLASHAIRMSHDNHHLSDTTNSNDNIGTKDRALISRVGNKLKHKSVLEQLVYWYDIDGISRACLQELARHRTARLTVKSSRYTLDEVKKAGDLFSYYTASWLWKWDIIEKFIVLTGDAEVDSSSACALSSLQDALTAGISNDKAKYCLPEAFKTRLQWQIDGRNLQNFLALRTSKDALWEIQLLAKGVYDALPTEHKYLYSEYVMANINTDTTNDNTIPTE
ncbi:MAG: FAD-dependent thymidylate synthase [Desulfuromonadaceae bacterium]|nr:FAD-dependent thymidylate synthase [Desulfuromonadaceae bacterium]